jgi:hypothetical protein
MNGLESKGLLLRYFNQNHSNAALVAASEASLIPSVVQAGFLCGFWPSERTKAYVRRPKSESGSGMGKNGVAGGQSTTADAPPPNGTKLAAA